MRILFFLGGKDLLANLGGGGGGGQKKEKREFKGGGKTRKNQAPLIGFVSSAEAPERGAKKKKYGKKKRSE